MVSFATRRLPQTDYMRNAFWKDTREYVLTKIVNKIEEILKENNLEKEDLLLVFTGYSGSVYGFSVADQLKINFAFCRKPNESTHSSYVLEGLLLPCKMIIFLDDCVDSGDTIDRVFTEIKKDTVMQYYNNFEDIKLITLLYDNWFNIKYAQKQCDKKHKNIKVISALTEEEGEELQELGAQDYI